MNLYNIGKVFSYSPDLCVGTIEGKYGIRYLSDKGDIMLPYEYDNIIIGGWEVNTFIIVKKGKYGIIHFEGERDLSGDIAAPHNQLSLYDKKPKIVFDLPCVYDYFESVLCGTMLFFNESETAVYIPDSHEIHHCQEAFADSCNIWLQKDNMLYMLDICGDILYSEPFSGFRFSIKEKNGIKYYSDPDKLERLIFDGNKYVLAKAHSSIDNVLHFSHEDISFSYYTRDAKSEMPDLCKSLNCTLIGIRDSRNINITLPFAFSLKYIGNNKFIVNLCGEFGVYSVACEGQTGNDAVQEEKENIYSGTFSVEPKYDFSAEIGEGYYSFSRDSECILYNPYEDKIII